MKRWRFGDELCGSGVERCPNIRAIVLYQAKATRYQYSAVQHSTSVHCSNALSQYSTPHHCSNALSLTSPLHLKQKLGCPSSPQDTPTPSPCPSLAATAHAHPGCGHQEMDW